MNHSSWRDPASFEAVVYEHWNQHTKSEHQEDLHEEIVYSYNRPYMHLPGSCIKLFFCSNNCQVRAGHELVNSNLRPKQKVSIILMDSVHRQVITS